MRALKKFRLEKDFSLKELHCYLNNHGLKVSFMAVVFWCLDFSSRHHRTITPKYVPKLIEITGYKFEDFYRDLPCEDSVSEAKAVVAAVSISSSSAN